jgi:hypothetical protein
MIVSSIGFVAPQRLPMPLHQEFIFVAGGTAGVVQYHGLVFS